MDPFWGTFAVLAFALVLLDIWRSDLTEAPTLLWLTVVVVVPPAALLWLAWGRWWVAGWHPLGRRS